MSKVKICIIGGTGLDNPDIIEHRKEIVISTPYGSSNIVEGTINGVDCVSILLICDYKRVLITYLKIYRFSFRVMVKVIHLCRQM